MKQTTLLIVLSAVAHCSGIPLEIDQNLWVNRIIGGNQADIGAHPHQASLRTAGNVHFCSGSLISSRSILTSASCLIGRSTVTTYAYLGSDQLDQQGASYKIQALILHHGFKPSTLENDIALAITETIVKFSANIRPIIYGYNKIGAGVGVNLTGWGEVSYPSGMTSEHLQVVELKTISPQECKNSLSENENIFESSLCTSGKDRKGGCFGDAGSPLVIGPSQVGVLSWGFSCASDHPAIYTRLSSHTMWIDSNKI